MLAHICCSVDSHYYLRHVAQRLGGQKLVGYFYNPNIHPYSEYRLRLMDVTRSCDMLHIPLVIGPYDYENWYKRTKTLQNEPEKGRRCDVCFLHRFEQTAIKAKELGMDKITTTLLMSPKKSYAQLVKNGRQIAKKHGVEFVDFDCTKASRNGQQNKVAKEAKLYRQNYCGCLYGLKDQRRAQNKQATELFECLDFKNEPGSFGRRAQMYEKRLRLESKGIFYDIIKNKTLTYRLLQAKVTEAGLVRASFFLPYSTMEPKRAKTRVEKVVTGVGYCNKAQIKICDISYFNIIAGTNFYSTTQLLRARLPFDRLLEVRRHIAGEFDLSPVVIMDSIPAKKLDIYLNALTQPETTEELQTYDFA